MEEAGAPLRHQHLEREEEDGPEVENSKIPPRLISFHVIFLHRTILLVAHGSRRRYSPRCIEGVAARLSMAFAIIFAMRGFL